MKASVTAFPHADTFTISYVVADPDGPRCAIVDSVLDFDPAAGKTDTQAADRIVAFVGEQGLTVERILETHVHADHLTAASYLKEKLGGDIGVGADVTVVQETFKKIFNVEAGFATDGSQFDHLYGDDETFRIGALEGRTLHTPGHTPACTTYVIGDAAFVGDTLFMPDFGTARTDFPGGDARALYHSVRRILSLPPETRLFMCHDYGPGGRDVAWETTVADERADNIHAHDGVSEDDFIAMRTKRDATLDMPRLILPSIQVNMRAGRMPPAEDNGVAYLKIPLNIL